SPGRGGRREERSPGREAGYAAYISQIGASVGRHSGAETGLYRRRGEVPGVSEARAERIGCGDGSDATGPDRKAERTGEAGSGVIGALSPKFLFLWGQGFRPAAGLPAGVLEACVTAGARRPEGRRQGRSPDPTRSETPTSL